MYVRVKPSCFAALLCEFGRAGCSGGLECVCMALPAPPTPTPADLLFTTVAEDGLCV